jgi:hypothetical protein
MPTSEAQKRANKKWQEKNKGITSEAQKRANKKWREANKEKYNSMCLVLTKKNNLYKRECERLRNILYLK